MEDSQQRSDQLRRMENSIRFGRVTQVDHKSKRVRLQVGELETDWIPWATARAGQDRTWWPPEIGEQMIVLAVSADLAQSVAMSSIYQQSAEAPSSNPNQALIEFSDGATFSYDKANGVLSFCLTGGEVRVCNADIVVTGGDVIADGISLKGCCGGGK